MKELLQLKKTLKQFLSAFVQRRRKERWGPSLLWLVEILEKFCPLLVHLLFLFWVLISSVLHVSLLFTFRLGLLLVKWRLTSLTKVSRSVPFPFHVFQSQSILILQMKESAWFDNTCVIHIMQRAALFFPL